MPKQIKLCDKVYDPTYKLCRMNGDCYSLLFYDDEIESYVVANYDGSLGPLGDYRYNRSIDKEEAFAEIERDTNKYLVKE